MEKFFLTIGPAATCFLLFLMFFTVIFTPLEIHAESGGILIGNSSVSAEALSKTDVMNIFLGKKTTWDNGNKITFVTLKEGDTHKQFLRTYVKRNPTQFKNHWKKMLFTGKGVIPKSFSSDKALIEFVANNENTVGYISQKATNPGIKVITITD